MIVSEPIKFVALGSPNIASGTILAYLLKSTPIRLDKVYIDLFQDDIASGKPKPGFLQRARRSIGDRQALRQNLGLAGVMPRHYFFRLLDKLIGINELRFLRWCERLSPDLLQRMCGFPLPEELSGKRVLCTFEEAVREHSLTVVPVASLNSKDAIEGLRSDAPDVIIGLGTRILKPDVLNTARIGILNGHSSLLPDYRGSVTEFWQLAGGETETGVTIHWMKPKVDRGAICGQRRWPIPEKTDHHRLRLMSLFFRLELWCDVVRRLIDGERTGEDQGEQRTPTFRRPTLEQQYDFYCRGIRVR